VQFNRVYALTPQLGARIADNWHYLRKIIASPFRHLMICELLHLQKSLAGDGVTL
jgi:hypothetical protein